jgi:DNA modification methylase
MPANDRKLDKLHATGLKTKDLIGIPWMLAFALRADGWYLRQDIIWHKPNPMPESVQDRCTKSHEYIFLLSKSSKYYYDHDAIKEPLKGEPQTRDKNAEGYQANYAHGDRFRKGERVFGADGLANKRSVWSVPVKPYAGAHFAVFPSELIEPCIIAGAPAGGVVLDPFMGSGSTGKAAIYEGFNFVGIELTPEYLPIAKARIEFALKDKEGELDFEPR